MNELVIEKVNGGLGRRNPSGDMICGLIGNGVAVVGGVQLNTPYLLKSVDDAESLLITESYDSTNTILVYEHIKEFFRINPNGDLYIMLVAQSVSYDSIINVSTAPIKSLLNFAEGKIKVLGVIYNPTTAVTDFSATTSAIPVAQSLATWCYQNKMPINVVLEGKGYTDYNFDFRALNSKKVSIMCGQDLSKTTTHSTYAAVGTLLGSISKAAVNENIAWVANHNVLGGTLITPGIGGNANSNWTEGNFDTANTKGAIFFRTHVGRAGVYFNDSHTCTTATDDFAYIENNRTIDKAVRSIREVLLPRLNSTVLLGDDGTLAPEVVKSYEADGKRALENMLKAGEISAFDVFIDPSQNILSSSELQIKFELTPTGTARKLKATVGFVNPF